MKRIRGLDGIELFQVCSSLSFCLKIERLIWYSIQPTPQRRLRSPAISFGCPSSTILVHNCCGIPPRRSTDRPNRPRNENHHTKATRQHPNLIPDGCFTNQQQQQPPSLTENPLGTILSPPSTRLNYYQIVPTNSVPLTICQNPPTADVPVRTVSSSN